MNTFCKTKHRFRITALKEKKMTTFLLSFHNLGAPAKKRSLGVAIFDMDETKGHKSATEIVRRAWDLGINPGGTCFFYEITFVPDQYKNQLITDEALLISSV